MRLRSWLVVSAISALALPAFADRDGVIVRDHGKKKDKGGVKVEAHPGKPVAATVSGFAPTSGRVGTVVTISGSYFVPQTKVHVGGRPVKSITTTDSQITFAIPERYYDGVITLKHPGVGQDIPVGTFAVTVDPNIASFAPASGPPGTRVEIVGAGFAAGDQILFNGKVLPTSELTATRLVVVVPQDGKTDAFTISRPAANYAMSSKQKFVVVQPAPQVSGLQPQSGGPGTQVRINGQNFAADDRVFYGAIPAQVVGTSPTWLDVIVPPTAKVSNAFLIKTSGRGSALTPIFNLVLPPSLSRFSPEWGGVGAQVEIFGASFAQTDQVWLGNSACKVLAWSEARLMVEVPGGAVTAAFTVRRGGQILATASKSFEVVAPPALSAFQPTSGPVGTKVTLTGQGFDAYTKVWYGAQPIGIAGRGLNTLDVIIPAGASSQPFLVETRGGRAQSAQSFQVITYSSITGVSPQKGPWGTRVTITVANPGPQDAFWLGTVALPIVERPQGAYVVTIPQGAPSGTIELSSYGQRFPSRWRFDVVQPPAITGFSPAQGLPGSQVVIQGQNFTAQAAAYYGNTPCTVAARNLPGAITVVIPPGATGADYLWIDDGGVRVKTGAPFKVLAPLSIIGFSPASGPVDTQVTINVNGAGAGAVVTLGAMAVPVVSRTAGTIVITVPAGAKSDSFWITDGGQKARSTASFTVTAPPPPPPPPPTRCTLNANPQSGPAGSQVTVTASGCTFSGKIRGWFGGADVQIVSSNASTVVVKLPANATGAQYIKIETDDGGGVAVRRQTETKFTISAGGVVVPAKPRGY